MELNKTEKTVFAVLGVALVGTLIFIFKPEKKKQQNHKPEKDSDGNKSILFIGDSNTALPYSYANKLQSEHPNLRIKNISKIGAKTDWMLSRLQDELKNNKYDFISILGGSNDIYALDSIDSAKKNLDDMYNLAKKNGSKVVAISPPSHNFFKRATEHKKKIQEDLMSWIANNKNKDYFINFYGMTNDKSLFSPKDGYLHAQEPAHINLSKKISSLLGI